ncbi:MAG: thrombospondin type 3 repeat-containing protein [Ignavibacteriales bacterium]|nr:thrombospondin type 3 repeat-containing protein [Ignavibacteriales bacterium]
MALLKYRLILFSCMMLISISLYSQTKSIPEEVTQVPDSSEKITFLRSFGLDFYGGGSYSLSQLKNDKIGWLGQASLSWLLPIESQSVSLGLIGTYQLGSLFPPKKTSEVRIIESLPQEIEYSIFMGGVTFLVNSESASFVLTMRAGRIFYITKIERTKIIDESEKLYETILYPSFGWKVWFSNWIGLGLEIGCGIPIQRKELNDIFIDAKMGLSFYFISDRDADDDGLPDDEDLDDSTDISEINSIDQFGIGPSKRDSDGDGVNDNLDKCDNRESGKSVDAKGCPLDSDKDGVYDYLDECNDTPKNTEVDKKGCPVDSDKDGVPNDKDNCENTPDDETADSSGCSKSQKDTDEDGFNDKIDKCPGEPEIFNFYNDADGCPDSAEYSLELLYSSPSNVFVADSSTISPKAYGLLYLELTSYLEDYPGTYWILYLESDKLAFQRAKVLKEYIETHLRDIGKMQSSDRILFESASGNATKIILKLNTEKAKDLIFNNK